MSTKLKRRTSEEHRIRERMKYAQRKDAEEAEKRAVIAKRWENVDYSKHEVRIKAR